MGHCQVANSSNPLEPRQPLDYTTYTTTPRHMYDTLAAELSDGSQERQAYAVRLPDEIWTKIWDCIPAQETDKLLPFAFVASWVSANWRRVAIHTPSLWRNIRISLHFPVELLKIQFERSTAIPLHVHIDLLWLNSIGSEGTFRNEDSLVLAVSLLAQSVDKCRVFELNASCASRDAKMYRRCLTAVMAPLNNARAPRLERLHIRCPEEDHPGPIFTGGVPRLSHLTLLATRCGTYLPILKGLTSLELSCFPHGNAMTPADFQNTLAACPDLTHLMIRNECITYDRRYASARESPLFLLPSLLSLSIELHHVDRYFARHFFAGFSAPHLESLHLQHFQWESYRAFVDAMCKDSTPRFPSLSKLSLVNVDILHTVLDAKSQNYCVKLLQCFPSVEELAIHTEDPGDSDFLRLLIPSATQEVLCPHLRSLSWLRQFPAEDEEHLLRDLVSSREAAGLKIDKLVCFHDAFAEFDPHTRDWICKHTKVELRDSVAFPEDL